MKTKSILGLLICIAFIYSLSFAQPINAASDEEEVLQVVTNFVKAYNTCNLELMSSLYWHSPNTSGFEPIAAYPFLFQGWEALGKYWKSNFELPAGTFTLSQHHPEVTMLGDNVAITTAYNTAIVNPPVVKEQTAYQVRQTLVVQKIDGKWLIVHGHASFLPTE